MYFLHVCGTDVGLSVCVRACVCAREHVGVGVFNVWKYVYIQTYVGVFMYFVSEGTVVDVILIIHYNMLYS
jgi:hypothetical protein